MSAGEWVRLGIAVLVAILSSSVVAALIQYRAQSPKVKAEAAKLNAETRAIGIDDQTQIIADLRGELARLSDRVAALEKRNEKAEALNGDLRRTLVMVSHWVRRVWSVLTPDQRADLGPLPADIDQLLNN